MTWIIDSAHTEVNFSVRHMMISNVRGYFQKFSGTIEFDPTNPVHTQIVVQIDVASLNTRDEKRDAHLKSPDFFDVKKYPYINFHSTRIDVKDKTHAVLYGELVIRDMPHEVALDVKFNGLANGPWGTTNAGFSAKAQLQRTTWGLNWNVALETGGWLVGDNILITIELEIINQPETVPVAAIAA
jgi:polyisoprenoid-binding protein YceI